ncbi:MAG: FAD:protein FMN transferase [Candidatus Omnitrophica bacterium]|nr:FAD:protein FMN transferase [Candidatus Omnitrophota bacterium]
MKRIALLLIILLFFSGCTKTSAPLVKRSQPHLGTIVEITVADQDKPRQFINKAIKKAFAEIRRVEDLLSRFGPESDISRINAQAHKQPTKVSAETITLLEKSIMFSELSDGAFDITVYPLMEIWGLRGEPKKEIPSALQLKEALGRVGYQNINIIKKEQSVFLSLPGMSLDLGGIAKGYAVDRAISILKQEGIKSALVNVGGDIYAWGKRDKSEGWMLGVQHPREKDTILSVLELENRAVATSGDYQKYIEIEGRRYSHIINPKSGFPCTDVPASVTVLAKDCVSADALATSAFILGPEKGVDLINQLENTEAIIVSVREDELDILLSQGLEGEIEFDNE